MNSKLFVVVALVAAVGLIVGFGAGRLSKPDRYVVRLLPEERTARTVESDAAAVELAAVEPRRIAVTEPVTQTIAEPKEPTFEEAIASLDRALRQRPISVGTDAEFERKYRGVSLAAAREAMLLLAARVDEEKAAIIKTRMEQGQFEEQRRGDGKAAPHVEGKGLSGSVLAFSQSIDDTGDLVTRSTTFDIENYPSLDAAQREMLYLQGMMRVPMKRPERTSK